MSTPTSKVMLMAELQSEQIELVFEGIDIRRFVALLMKLQPLIGDVDEHKLLKAKRLIGRKNDSKFGRDWIWEGLQTK